MSNFSYFPVPASSKDGMCRIRVTKQSKGVLGNIIDETGFLKFEDQATADTALAALESGEAGVEFGTKINGLYEITAVAASELVHA